tara:strand:- start:566 stop:721 length:156 start_codon:yes stop_codon:yes gene_type:complete
MSDYIDDYIRVMNGKAVFAKTDEEVKQEFFKKAKRDINLAIESGLIKYGKK